MEYSTYKELSVFVICTSVYVQFLCTSMASFVQLVSTLSGLKTWVVWTLPSLQIVSTCEMVLVYASIGDGLWCAVSKRCGWSHCWPTSPLAPTVSVSDMMWARFGAWLYPMYHIMSVKYGRVAYCFHDVRTAIWLTWNKNGYVACSFVSKQSKPKQWSCFVSLML